METRIEADVIEMMKSQMAVLKHKLESQSILNERLIRRVMHARMQWVRKVVAVNVCMCVLVIAFVYVMMARYGWSPAFFWVTVALFVAVAAASIWVNVYGHVDLLEGNLVEAGRALVRMKRLRTQGRLVKLPLGLAWVCWYAIEAMDFAEAVGLERGRMLLIICLAGAVGLVIGLVVFNKFQRANDDIIAQIDELTGSKDRP